jgi:hypothetical protein
MSTKNEEFQFECFESYHGDAENVKKKIDDCKICGSKLMLTHLPDYKNLLIQETARCMECGEHGNKIIHVLN